MDVLVVDNRAVLENQIRRLTRIRADRDQAAVTDRLEALTRAAREESGNLLDLAIQAMEKRATVGEVSDALESVYGRHHDNAQTVKGVYGDVWQDDAGWRSLQERVSAFAESEGRRPRMLVVKMGQDGHDRGAKVIASAFADIGFDIDLGPLFQTPEEAARQAVENDVHLVGVSTLAGAHATLIPGLIEALKTAGARDVIVVAGGVIPPGDHQALKEAGVAAVFGPGSSIVEVAGTLMDLLCTGE
jgi:methylmalonyl-CoA mutase